MSTSTPRTPEQLLKLPLEELELSVRTVNCLKAAGFYTVADAVNAFDTQDGQRMLLSVPHLGRKSFNELRETLGALVNHRNRAILEWVAAHGDEIEAIMDGRAAIVPTFRGLRGEE